MRTRVGYAGGSKKAPTYRSLGDHTETIQIDYDPTQVSYRQLLDIFWGNHTPTSKPWSRQYMAAVFYHGEAQKKAATESKEREASRRKARIHTQILPYTGFHMAEDYHQKYALRQNRDFLREMETIYPDLEGLISSTAAARLNGYLGGYGTLELLREELDGYGLSPELRQKLVDRVKERENAGGSCARR